MSCPDGQLQRLRSKNGQTDDVARVILYPNSYQVQQNETSDSGIVTNAVENGLEQLYNNNAIDGYEISQWYTYDSYPNLTSSSKDTYKDEHLNWLENCSGFYPGYAGVHFGVTEGFDGAGGVSYADYDNRNLDGHSNADETAFREGLMMVLGLDGSDGRVKNFSIQEPLHVFMCQQVMYDQGVLPSKDSRDPWDDHHRCGKIRNHNQTPLITTHPGLADEKICKNKESSSGYDQDLTSCSIDAVDVTEDAI